VTYMLLNCALKLVEEIILLLEIGFGMVDFEIFLKAQNCFTFLTPK